MFTAAHSPGPLWPGTYSSSRLYSDGEYQTGITSPRRVLITPGAKYAVLAYPGMVYGEAACG